MFESIVKVPLASTANAYHKSVWDVVSPTKTDFAQSRKFIFKVREGSSAAFVKIRSAIPLGANFEKCKPVILNADYELSLTLTLDPDDIAVSRLMNVESVTKWLDTRLPLRGMKPSVLHVEFLSGVDFGKKDNKWRFKQIQVSGIIKVTDVELAETCLIEGIGKGRGFGFGLIELEALNG